MASARNNQLISEQSYRLQQTGGIPERTKASQERYEEHQRTDHDQKQSWIHGQGVHHIYTHVQQNAHTRTHTSYMIGSAD